MSGLAVKVLEPTGDAADAGLTSEWLRNIVVSNLSAKNIRTFSAEQIDQGDLGPGTPGVLEVQLAYLERRPV